MIGGRCNCGLGPKNIYPPRMTRDPILPGRYGMKPPSREDTQRRLFPAFYDRDLDLA